MLLSIFNETALTYAEPISSPMMVPGFAIIFASGWLMNNDKKVRR
jgi:hypothetical protein